MVLNCSGFHRSWYYVVGENSHLLLVGVGVQSDLVHSIYQWFGYHVLVVGSADKQDVGKAHWYIHVVIEELSVLLGI